MDVREKRYGETETRNTATVNTDPTRTKQEFKEVTNIRKIMKKYERTGELTHIAPELMAYANFTEVPDLKTALDNVDNVRAKFQELPGLIRKEFAHDPTKLVEFVRDPANLERGRELGIFKPEERAKPMPTAQETGAPDEPAPETPPATEPTA